MAKVKCLRAVNNSLRFLFLAVRQDKLQMHHLTMAMPFGQRMANTFTSVQTCVKTEKLKALILTSIPFLFLMESSQNLLIVMAPMGIQPSHLMERKWPI